MDEFREIAHSGGKIRITVTKTDDGRVGYQIGLTHCRPVRTVIISLYATIDGLPLCPMAISGIGGESSSPPTPRALQVFMGSDSEGFFGHECPECNRYWRSGPWPNTCPYCRLECAPINFLSAAQKRYVERFCEVLADALYSDFVGDIEIDMDSVADAAGKDGDKPPFYMSDESQQCKFNCRACDEFNDVLGRFAYCSSCGTLNGLDELLSRTIPSIHEKLKSGHSPEDCLRDAVSVFDTFLSQLAKQLAQLVPLTDQRRQRLMRNRFHNLKDAETIFREWFDIRIRKGISNESFEKLRVMFLRRHLYEHNGGEVDQHYIDESGDASVRLKQHIRESLSDVHWVLSMVEVALKNANDGFHEVIRPIEGPIKAHREHQERMARHRNQ